MSDLIVSITPTFINHVLRHTESPVDDFDYTDALLRFACTVGHVDIVRSLVTIHGGNADYSTSRKNSMLCEACCAGQVEIVRELIAAGADVNGTSDSQNTPLIYAATAGKIEVCRAVADSCDSTFCCCSVFASSSSIRASQSTPAI